jgi:hypothetical protein
VVAVDVSKFRKNGPTKIYTVVEQRTLARCDSEGDAELLVTVLNEAHGNKDRVDTVGGKLVPSVDPQDFAETLGADLAVRMTQCRNHEDRMVHHAGPGYLAYITVEGAKSKTWVRYVPEGKEVQTTTKRKRA